MKKQVKNPLMTFYIILLIVIIGFNLLMNAFSGFQNKNVTYNQFLDHIDQRIINEVEIGDQEITYTLKDDKSIYSTEVMEYDYQLVQRLNEADAKFTRFHTKELSPLMSFLLTFVLPMAIFGWLGNRAIKKLTKNMGDNQMTFGGGFTNFGKSDAKIYVKSESGITFKDVAGQEEAKDAMKEMVDFLKNPQKYSAIGAKMPKGALLVGPPGTGKTLLAKAVAGEANVPFFSISGSEFVEMFVGRGAARVRDLFKQAREKAPCIVFIDEIDTIGKKRDGSGFSGNDEREQTLNQLLAEMDGFDASKGVIILAATNRPESLDQALLRPGRFDRRIPVELPDLIGREAILKVHAKDVKMSKNVDFKAIARASAGASGAELANMINEAAILAVKDNRSQVIQKDLEDAFEIVIAGYKRKNTMLSNKEKLVVSYHEIGHALVSALNKNAMPVSKITIVPRTSGALGFTLQVPEDESHLITKEEAFAKLMTYCGGRAAESLIFNQITSGASNDIEQATKLARTMITRLGMSDTFGMVALETTTNKYLGGDTSLACSEQTSALIDHEVKKLIEDAYLQAYELLKQNKDKLHELSKFLYEKETITGEEFMNILNKNA